MKMNEGRTARSVASVAFGLGSFILMADIAQVVIRNGDEGGDLFQMGFPSFMGIGGMVLWGFAMVILVRIRFPGANRRKKKGIRSIFLRGRRSFRCPSCGKRVDASRVDYSERIVCECGTGFDVFQDPERT